MDYYGYSKDDGLKHYGVLGMKWGVRNSETKARYERSNRRSHLNAPSQESSRRLRKAYANYTKADYAGYVHQQHYNSMGKNTDPKAWREYNIEGNKINKRRGKAALKLAKAYMKEKSVSSQKEGRTRAERDNDRMLNEAKKRGLSAVENYIHTGNVDGVKRDPIVQASRYGFKAPSKRVAKEYVSAVEKNTANEYKFIDAYRKLYSKVPDSILDDRDQDRYVNKHYPDESKKLTQLDIQRLESYKKVRDLEQRYGTR